MDTPALVAPLILLLIVLLLPLLGCGLSTSGAGWEPPEPPFEHPVSLHLADIPDVVLGLKGIHVEFEFIPDSTNVGNVNGQKTEHSLTPDEITLGMFIHDFNVVDLSSAGTVKCSCWIFWEAFSSAEPKAEQQKIADEPLPAFVLTGEGRHDWALSSPS
jgi:hypothetical protein